MKKLILVIILFPSLVFAAPFLVCDQHPMQSDPSLYFTVSGLPNDINASHIDKEPVGNLYGFKLDVSALPNGGGPYTARAKACISDPVWGERCSADSNPFVFSVPQVPVLPTGIKLIP